MSLEQALAENTAAIQALIAVLTAQASSAHVASSPAPAPAPVAAAKKPAKAAASAPAATDAPAAAEASPTTQPAAASAAAPAALTYEDHVKPKLTQALASLGREKVVSILGDFGVGRGTELTPDQFAPFLEALQA